MNTTSPHFLQQRRFDIDAIRVIAFGFLIFYHIGMFYVSDWGWHIKSQYQYHWLQQPMMFVNQWRMALLFVISGMATAILLHKFELAGKQSTSIVFLTKRVRKLGLPLLFGMFVIVVPQAWLEAKANNAFNGNFLNFWYQYLTFGQWQKGAFAGSDFGVTWNHLWYLPYTIFYTFITVSLRVVIKVLLPVFNAQILSGALWRWYAVMLFVLISCGLFIFPLFPDRTHALIDDWYTHSLFFSFFTFGYFLIRSQTIWVTLKKRKWRLLLLASVSYGAFQIVNNTVPQDANAFWTLGQLVLVYLNRLSWVLVIFAFAYSYLNRDSALLRYSNKAVFSWYILHQTIIIVLGSWLSRLAVGGTAEFIMVLFGTITSCLVLHHFVVRRFRFLHGLFGYAEKQSRTVKTSNKALDFAS